MITVEPKTGISGVTKFKVSYIFGNVEDMQMSSWRR